MLHPCSEGEEWHDLSCYDQLCNSSECGRDKFFAILCPLLESSAGNRSTSYFQHEKKIYQKPDGTKGSKWELVEKMSTLSEVSRLLADKMFGKNRHETYLQHVFRKVLGSRGRANLRKNIGDSDVIVYSDFSKGTLFFHVYYLKFLYF